MNSRRQLAYEKLPKDPHWTENRRARLGKLGLTPEIIMETLEAPHYSTESGYRGRNHAYYRYYLPGSPEAEIADGARGGAWFRVVLNGEGHLLTAFRDVKTEEAGGLQ